MLNIKTKIIATLGPSSNSPSIISQLIKNGMNVARINMGHFKNVEELECMIKIVRTESSKQDKHVGILVDLAGPKIRLNLDNLDGKKKELIKGENYTLGFSDNNDLRINTDIQFKNIRTGESFVKIDDGKIILEVIEQNKNNLILRATQTVIVKNRKGVNFPGIDLGVPPLTNADKEHILYALKYEVDWLALSFVRESSDINSILNIYKEKNKSIPIIAKIEKPEAIKNLDSIINSFHGVLIARGDLGVEVSLSKLPSLQKLIIEKCRKFKKPVIVATQMLESMIENSTPTRAEVNDVANAVYQSVDAVMLSGETAVGKYPVDTIKIMREILLNTEEEIKKNNVSNTVDIEIDKDTRSAIGESVKIISQHLNIDAIVVMTESGSTGIIVSHYRPQNNIFALTPHKTICNKLALVWGVYPILTPQYDSTDTMIREAKELLIQNNLLDYGDMFVLTAGVPVGKTSTTNMLKIHKIEKTN